ncbi:MAG: hypothetical protein IJ622_06315 [Bacteroidales bacterium]|nr:hypothetical protein [Bacteroidales bacterium]
MLLIITPIAVVIGVLIAKYYKPKNKSEKVWASILIPLISGILIHLLVASCKNSGYGFAFDLGATIVFVAIPTVALLITLFIKLKVENVDKKEIKNSNETVDVPLHYGTGENRVNFELQLTKEEILKMGEMRREDPDKWEDNDLELVKAVKNALLIEKEKEQDIKCDDENIVEESSTSNSKQTVEPMIVAQVAEDAKATEVTTEPIAELVEEKPNLFGNKLESEYRREAETTAHWIMQNGTEMCINIDDATYQRMVELQNQNPKKWVDNEFNLYLQAASSKQNGRKKSRTWKMKKWMWVVAILIGICTIYGVVARVVDNTVATCNEEMMQGVYEVLKYQEHVSCSYPTFRYRMIANSLYRKQMYNLYPKYPYKWKGQWHDKQCDYKEYVFNLRINKWLENPFVWVW